MNKKGFTLVEVLITTIIYSVFMILTYPLYNNIFKSFNEVNKTQINVLNVIRLREKINQITGYENDIYFQDEKNLLITINENKISFGLNNEILINDMNYEAILTNYVITDEFIILNCKMDNIGSIYILRGNLYEICSS